MKNKQKKYGNNELINIVMKGEIKMYNTNVTENLNMLNTIYQAREEELRIISEDFRKKLNDVTIEEIQNLIEKNLESSTEKRKVLNDLELLIENYEMKMSNFMENSYKQGFKDAFDLFLECTREQIL